MTGKETIHSGHFMVSKYDEESDNDENCDINQLNRIKKGFNFDQFDSNSNIKKEKIDESLTKMMQFLSVAMEGQITNPKWNSFKGVQFNSRDKIRLNNIIWREYHMQFVKQAPAVVVKFAPALTETPQVHGDRNERTKKSLYNVVLEGKYWKRQNDIIVRQYKKWRKYFKERCLTNPAYCHYFGGIDRLFGDDSFYNDLIYQIDDAPSLAMTTNTLCSMDSNDINNNNSFNSSYLSIQTNTAPPITNNNTFTTTQQPQNSHQNLYEPLFNRIQLQSHPTHHGNNNFIMHNLNNHNNQQNHNNSMVSWHSQAGIAPTHTIDSATKFSNKDRNNVTNNRNQRNMHQPGMTASSFMTSSIYDAGGGINLKPRSSSPPPNLSDVFMDLDDHLLMPLSEYGAIPGEHHCQVIQPQLNNLQPRMESTIDFLNDFIYEAPMNSLKSQRTFASESSIHSYPHYIPQAPIHKQSQQPPAPQPMSVTAAVTQPPPSSLSSSHIQKPSSQSVTRIKHPNNECKQMKLESSPTEVNPAGNGNVLCKTPNLLSMLLQPIQTTTNNVNLAKCKPQTNKHNGASTSSNFLFQKTSRSSSNPNQNFHNENSNIFSQSTTRNNNSLVKTQINPNIATTSHINQYSPNNSNLTEVNTNSVSNSCSTRSSGDSSTFSVNILNSTSYSNKPPQPQPPPPSHNNNNDNNNNNKDNKPGHSNIRELLLYQQPPETASNPVHQPPVTVAKRRCSGPPIEPVNPFSCHAFSKDPSSMSISHSSSSSLSSSIARKPTTSFPAPPPTSSSTNTLVQHYIDELFNLLLPQHSLASPNNSDTHSFLHSHSQMSHSNGSQNKVSKAALLQKAADTIKRLRNEKHRLIEEIGELHNEIDMLQNQFSTFCSKLPANGVCVKSPTKSYEPKKWFNEFVISQSQVNWKFYVFYILFESLFTSYDNSVSTQSMDEMVHNVAKWLEKECSLVKLRLIVINGMRNLSRKTSIVQHPNRLSEEVTQLLYQHHHHHHLTNSPIAPTHSRERNPVSMHSTSPTSNHQQPFYDNSTNNPPFQ